MNQINQFSTIVIIVNLIYTGTGILVFRKVGFYALSLLFYGGISSLVEFIKLFLMTRSLQNNYHYYINNNIDILNEPFFVIKLLLYSVIRTNRWFYFSCIESYLLCAINSKLFQNCLSVICTTSMAFLSFEWFVEFFILFKKRIWPSQKIK